MALQQGPILGFDEDEFINDVRSGSQDPRDIEDPNVRQVVMDAYGSMERAMDAFKKGLQTKNVGREKRDLDALREFGIGVSESSAGPVGGGGGGDVGANVQGIADAINQAANRSIARLGQGLERSQQQVQQGFTARGLRRSGLAAGAVNDLQRHTLDKQQQIEDRRLRELSELGRQAVQDRAQLRMQERQAELQAETARQRARLNAPRYSPDDSDETEGRLFGIVGRPRGLTSGGGGGQQVEQEHEDFDDLLQGGTQGTQGGIFEEQDHLSDESLKEFTTGLSL